MTSLSTYGSYSFYCYYFGICSGGGDTTPTASVPEIDASSGALAIAVLIAALLLVREFRNRA